MLVSMQVTMGDILLIHSYQSSGLGKPMVNAQITATTPVPTHSLSFNTKTVGARITSLPLQPIFPIAIGIAPVTILRSAATRMTVYSSTSSSLGSLLVLQEEAQGHLQQT